MSDHQKCLVPIEAWAYSSPGIKGLGKTVDVGLMAESLIYYDAIYLNLANQPQLAELLQWFITDGTYSDFLSLLADGTITFYEYSFLTAPILVDGTYSLWNVQDEAQVVPNSFERRFLYHPVIKGVLQHARQRQQLYKAFHGRVIEVKSESISDALANARADSLDPRRNQIIVQAFVDEVWALRNLGRPPEVKATVVEEDGKAHITWNVNFDELSRIAGTGIGFHVSTPLAGGAISNRALWSASELGFRQVLALRGKSRRFRDWLRSEADRDRDALIAYHNEVAKEAGFTSVGRRALNLFGIVGGGAVGGAIGSTLAGPAGGAIGGIAGSSVGYLADLASKLGTGWKPVVFGNWMKQRIEAYAKAQKRD